MWESKLSLLLLFQGIDMLRWLVTQQQLTTALAQPFDYPTLSHIPPEYNQLQETGLEETTHSKLGST